MNRSTPDSFDALFLSTGLRLGHFSSKEAGDAAEAAAKLGRSGHPVPIETLAMSLGLAEEDAVKAILAEVEEGEFRCASCGMAIAGLAIARRRSVSCPKCGEAGVERVSQAKTRAPAVRASKPATRVERADASNASTLTGLALAAVRRLTFPDEPESKPEPGDPFLGKTFGRYRIKSLLGIGGWGNIYLAESEGGEFALKILRLELGHSVEHLDRFMTEARLTASLEHGVIRRTVDIGKHHRQHYMAMEYVDGRSLHELVVKNGPLAPVLSVQLASRLADALQFAARRGVIHRDVKPRNVLIARAGEVKLTDFGLARMLLDGSGMTGTGSVMGTPEFMSPEQFEGARADQRSDIYSLGCTLFFMLTGRPPFEGADFATLMRLHRTATPPSPLRFNSDIPLPLCSALSRMLEKKPSARFQDYGEILEAFTGTSGKSGAEAEGLEEQWMDEERVKRCVEVQAVFTAVNMVPPPRWHVLSGLGYATGEDEESEDDFFDQQVVLRCGQCKRSFRFKPPLKNAFGCPTCGGVELEHEGFSIGSHACYLFLRIDDAGAAIAGAGDDLVRVANMATQGGARNVVLDFSACAGFPSEIMGPLLRLRVMLTSDRIAPALLASPRGLKQIKERGLQEFFLAFASEKDLLGHIDAASLCPHLRYFLCAVRGQLTEQEEQVAENLALSIRSCIDRESFEAFYPTVREALRKNDARAARAACVVLTRRLAKAPCLQAAAKKARDFAEDAIRHALEHSAQAHLARGRIDRARIAARETLASFPESPAAADVLAQIALREGRPSEAAGHFEAAARDAKEPAEYRLSEAVALQRAGDVPGALQCLDAILAEDPSHFRAAQFKGTLHFGRGEYEEAREAFTRALEIQPASADVLLWRGRTHHRLNLLQESLRDFVHANRAEPRRPRTLANCGAICARLGRHKEAIAFLRSAIRLSPALAGPRYNLACALAASGEPEAALEALREAVAAGWANRQLAERDVLLDSLRQDETTSREFAAILDSMSAQGETEDY